MIRRIRIDGLKCFKEAELNFADFTLLAGKNSTGKSTVIQAVLALFQNNASSLAGSYVNIGKMSEVKNKIAGSKEIAIEASYDHEGEMHQYGKRFLDDSTEMKYGDRFPGSMNVVYLAADRVGVKDTYEKSLDGNQKIGNRCEFAFYYLSEHQMEPIKDEDFIYDETTKLTLGGQVDYWLERILGYRGRAEEIDGTDLIRVVYGNKELGMYISPRNVGTGVSYIAEIIIAAFSCKKGDLLIIENPEIHLHPSGQAEFIEFMVFLARKGIQVVMETHSDHIYNGLRRCVSSDRIAKDKVSIYYFAQSREKIGEPVAILLDENGHVENQQDGLFDQVEKDLDVILGW